MVDLSTTYLGLELDNPLIPSASPLSRDLDTARRLEDAGAPALVMYSLFEEVIAEAEESAARFLHEQSIGCGEAESFLPVPEAYATELDEYLEQIHALKRTLSIPIIASLNGVSMDGWLRYGKLLEEAGADALELNVYHIAANAWEPAAEVEERYIELLSELREAVQLPIAMKLSSQFSSVGHMVQRLEEAGANGVALFNRFYQPDIDLDTLQVVPRLSLSHSEESLLRIRWIAVLHGRVKLSLAVTGGMHTAEDILKAVLAGADVTHLASALLKHGPEYLTSLLKAIRKWLNKHEYESLQQLKGSLSQQHAPDPAAFERANYVQVLDSWKTPDGVWR